jgi:hypothetical protein
MKQAPSKSMAYQKEKSNDIEQAQKAIKDGAKIVSDNGVYAIEYPEGGYFKITKTVFKKLTKTANSI